MRFDPAMILVALVVIPAIVVLLFGGDCRAECPQCHSKAGVKERWASPSSISLHCLKCNALIGIEEGLEDIEGSWW